MLELTNLRTSNIELPNHNTSSEVSLNEADKIKGSGPLSLAGGLAGALTGGTVGMITYPVKQGYKELVSGDSDFNATDYGAEIVGSATGFGATGAGIGKIIESGFGGGPRL